MLRDAARALIVLACLAPAAWGQNLFISPGSTVEGDYLRGVGVAAWGMGTYNLNTARANSINLDTAIRWNEYVAAVLQYENRKNALAAQQHTLRQREDYNKIRERIRDTPEERDVQQGDAMNTVMEQLKSPQNHPSSFRRSGVTIPADAIRRIPFRVDEEGRGFSMERIIPRGKGKWPVLLRDPGFDQERKVYERAIDNALGQAIDGKMSIEATQGVEVAVSRLLARLDVVAADTRVDTKGELYRGAKEYLRNLQTAAGLFYSPKIERVLGELDKYSGTTVADLKEFMQSHKLRFGVASTPEERRLYPELYAAMIQQREALAGRDNPGAK